MQCMSLHGFRAHSGIGVLCYFVSLYVFSSLHQRYLFLLALVAMLQHSSGILVSYTVDIHKGTMHVKPYPK